MGTMDLQLVNFSVKLAVISSGLLLWIGMATGVWKYIQIANSEQARAHYYVDIAHRSSLLYAPAMLIIAMLAYCSSFDETINLSLVFINLFFFFFSILSYIVHGLLRDTTNQFKKPHRLGRFNLPSFLMRFMMLLLIVGEIGATSLLIYGACKGLF